MRYWIVVVVLALALDLFYDRRRWSRLLHDVSQAWRIRKRRRLERNWSTVQITLAMPTTPAGFGSAATRRVVRTFTDRLDEYLAVAAAGYVDGDGYGEDEADVFVLGPDPDQVITIARRALDELSLGDSATFT